MTDGGDGGAESGDADRPTDEAPGGAGEDGAHGADGDAIRETGTDAARGGAGTSAGEAPEGTAPDGVAGASSPGRPAPATGEGPARSGTSTRTLYGETWVYESIVGAVPGVSVSRAAALALQFALFEGVLLVLATVYDLWSAVPAGTAAVVVATGGSFLMQRMGARARAADLPATYRRALFGSSVEVVLGVFSFVGLLTYLLAVDPLDASVLGVALRRAPAPLLTDLLGDPPPVAPTFLLLLVVWDVCYRIGTGWWAAVVAVWRSYSYGFDPATAAALRRVDGLNAGFALLQLLLVPFVWDHTLLTALVVGHVAATLTVVGASLALLGRSSG